MSIEFNFKCCPVNAPTKVLYCDNCKRIISGNDLLIDDKGRYVHICGNPVSTKTMDELNKLKESKELIDDKE